jgi:hypothetical protein
MKLYVIVRKDLSVSQRAVQAGHVVAQFCLYGPFSRWKNGTLIYLGIKNLEHLEELINQLNNNNINYTEFREPDIGNQVTAIATDQHYKLFERMRLL